MKKPAPTLPLHPFRACRRAGVPIVLYETADAAVTIQNISRALNGQAQAAPMLSWDCVRYLQGLNTPGTGYINAIPEDVKFALQAPASMLHYIATHPPIELDTPKDTAAGGIVFLHLAHKFMDQDPSTIQAIWNCREPLKAAGVTLVLLAPSGKLPIELCRDIVVLCEPLPTAAELAPVLDSICEDAGISSPTDQPRAAVLDTLLGLSGFEAEQTLALSITRDGIDRAALWDRKVKAIEQTPGLTVYRGKEKFADIGGLDNAKQIIGRTITGKTAVSCLVFLDEFDKALSAATSDMSGTTQDQNRGLLTYMQDNEILGILELGPPGTGKTALPKAAAGEFGIPLIMLDLGALKGSLVGQSEQNMRHALKVIHAISNGRALFIAACNRADGLPPETRRRFSYASMFFDLSDRDELDSIWAIWKRKYSLSAEQCDAVTDSGWAGSEIKNCCLKAWTMDCKLSEAAKTIVPVSRSAGDLIEALRKSASGKYISASQPGIYNSDPATTPAAPAQKRRIQNA